MPTINRLPSGKYRVQVRRRGIYRARTFDRKADAREWGVDMERLIRGGSKAGTVALPRDMTLGDIVGAYLQQVETRRTTRFNLERIRERIGGTAIADLDAIVLQGFIDGRLKDGAGGVTISGDLSALSSVLRWARAAKNLDIDPDLAAAARQSLTARKINTRSEERTRIPTEDELRQILDFVDGNTRLKIPAGTIVRFAATSAMRLGEICRIRIEEISWNEKTVLIRERKDPKRKDRNDQVVPLLGEAYDIAREVAGARTDGRLFPYNSKSVSEIFTRTTRRLGIEDLHFHDLRHLAITNLFRAGLPIQLVAVVSGHRDWRHLKRYTQLNATDVHVALNRLQN